MSARTENSYPGTYLFRRTSFSLGKWKKRCACLPPCELQSPAPSSEGEGDPSRSSRDTPERCEGTQTACCSRVSSSLPYTSLRRRFSRCCQCLAPGLVVVCSLVGLVLWRRSIEGIVTETEFRRAFFGNSYGFFTTELVLQRRSPSLEGCEDRRGGETPPVRTSVLPPAEALTFLARADSQAGISEKPLRPSLQVVGEDGTVSEFLQQVFQEPPGHPYFCGDARYPAEEAATLHEATGKTTSSSSTPPPVH